MRADNLTVKTREDLERLKEEYGVDTDIGIIHFDTGECEEIANGTSIKHPKLKPKNKSGEYLISQFKQKELFVKAYKNPIEILGKELTNRDFAWFVRLIPYIHMQDCTLYDDAKNEYLTVKRISELMDVNYDNLQAVLKSLQKKGLIAYIERPSLHDRYKTVKVIAVNPYIMMNGECLLEQTNDLFKDKDWISLVKGDKNNKKANKSKTA